MAGAYGVSAGRKAIIRCASTIFCVSIMFRSLARRRVVRRREPLRRRRRIGGKTPAMRAHAGVERLARRKPYLLRIAAVAKIGRRSPDGVAPLATSGLQRVGINGSVRGPRLEAHEAPAAGGHARVELRVADILRIAAVANSGGGLPGGFAAQTAMRRQDVSVAVCAVLGSGSLSRRGRNVVLRAPGRPHAMTGRRRGAFTDDHGRSTVRVRCRDKHISMPG